MNETSTLSTIRDGEPEALALVCVRWGPAVLAYCWHVSAPDDVDTVASEAFGLFRSALAADESDAGAGRTIRTAVQRAVAVRGVSTAVGRSASTSAACDGVRQSLLIDMADASPSDGEGRRRHLAECSDCFAAASRVRAAEWAFRYPPPRTVPSSLSRSMLLAMVSAAPVVALDGDCVRVREAAERKLADLRPPNRPPVPPSSRTGALVTGRLSLALGTAPRRTGRMSSSALSRGPLADCLAPIVAMAAGWRALWRRSWHRVVGSRRPEVNRRVASLRAAALAGAALLVAVVGAGLLTAGGTQRVSGETAASARIPAAATVEATTPPGATDGEVLGISDSDALSQSVKDTQRARTRKQVSARRAASRRAASRRAASRRAGRARVTVARAQARRASRAPARARASRLAATAAVRSAPRTSSAPPVRMTVPPRRATAPPPAVVAPPAPAPRAPRPAAPSQPAGGDFAVGGET